MLAAVHVHGSTDIETIIVYVTAALLGAALTFLVKESIKSRKHNKIVGEFVMGRPEVKDEAGNLIQVGILPARTQMDALTTGQAALQAGQEDIKAHLTEQDVKIDRVEHEVQENGGGSVKDGVNRVETKVDNAVQTMGNVCAQVNSIEEKLIRHMNEVGDGETVTTATATITTHPKA